MASLYEHAYMPGPHNGWKIFEPSPPPEYINFNLNMANHNHPMQQQQQHELQVDGPWLDPAELVVHDFPTKEQQPLNPKSEGKCNLQEP